jgi:hypothetical protein
VNLKGCLKFLIICSVFIFTSFSFAQEQKKTITDILDSAENFFKALSDKKFDNAWMLLTKNSQETIIVDVYNASKMLGVTYTHDQLRGDFNINGFISKTYWNGFLKNFDPRIVLEECIWEKVLQKKDYAEIVIRYQKSDNPFYLKMFKENDVWKVGLVETFWKK